MENPSEPASEEIPVEVRSYFVRGRNALLARAHLADLYLDYYLHQGQLGVLPGRPLHASGRGRGGRV